ncbi:MAG: UbiA family prenyltransferase [bacterium]|nr:UbiA family prenyltransferase [bacterium]
MQLRAFPVLDRVELRSRARSVLPPIPRAMPGPRFLTALEMTHWPVPTMAVVAGAMAVPHDGASLEVWFRVALGALLMGPLVNAASSLVARFFDHASTAELPQGERDLWITAMGSLSIVAAVVGHLLGDFAFWASTISIGIALTLSAPPLRLRREAWWNGLFGSLNLVLLPWMLGSALMGTSPVEAWLLATVFAFGAVGLHLGLTLDQSAHDRLAGLKTLGAVFGPEVGALVAAVMVDTSLVGAAIVGAGKQSPASLLAIALLTVWMIALQVLAIRVPVGRRGGFFMAMQVLFLLAMAVGVVASPTAILQL